MSEVGQAIEDSISPVQVQEKLLKTDDDFLGTKDLGFSPRRIGELSASLENTQLAYNQYATAVELERDKLEEEFGRGRLRVTKPEGFLAASRATRGKPDPGWLERSNRYSEIMWGDPKFSVFSREIRDLEEGLFDEKYKKSDATDLATAIANVRKVKDKPINREVLPKLSPGDSFREMSDRVPSQDEEELGTRMSNEVWFHTTSHIDKVITNGGIATQAWIKKHDPEYYQILVDNSTAQGLVQRGEGRIDPALSSPLNKGDYDRIFFRANTVESYGPTIIAYAPEDILADNNLYFLKNGVSHMDERVVSDIVDLDSDSIPPNGESGLSLPLEKAYMAVPKENFEDTCVKLLEEGYSPDWIKAHMFSYRGRGAESYKGQRVAAAEIKRRIAEERSKRGAREFVAVGNPKYKYIREYPMGANVFQLITEKHRGEVKAETESITDLSVVENMDSARLLNHFSGLYPDVYAASAGVWEGYTIGQHTEMVLAQYDKYFDSDPFFRVVLAVHDIGKAEAVKRGNKSLQHELNREKVAQILTDLHASEDQIKLASALVSTDVVGHAIITGNYEMDASRIKSIATEYGLDTAKLFDSLVIMHMVDAGSYTENAGGKKSLDVLFVFDEANKKMTYSPDVEQKVGRLRTAVMKS